MALIRFFLCFVLINAAISWEVTYYATLTTSDFDFISVATLTQTVFPTAPVTPISTATYVDQSQELAVYQAPGGVPINVTTKYLILPNTSLPLWTGQYAPTTSTIAHTNIETNYYAPVTVSNPSTCTKTTFTYTDSISIFVPDNLTPQATDPTVAAFVSSYVVTAGTDLGGQAITTTQCDVYLNSQAAPSIDPYPWDKYLDECVDPRHYICTSGGNIAATGTAGCQGTYPPRDKSESAGTLTSGPSSKTQTASTGRATGSTSITGTAATPQKTSGGIKGCKISVAKMAVVTLFCTLLSFLI